MNKIKYYLRKITPLVRMYRTLVSRIDLIKYKKIQSRYSDLLDSKRNKLKGNNKIRIAFFVTQKQLWCLQSVYDAFLENESFEVVVVVFPNEEDEINSKKFSMVDNFNFFKSFGLNVICGYDEKTKLHISAKEINADIIFYDQPFPQLSEDLSFERTCFDALVCYVPYGYKVGNAYEGHFNMPLQNSCWKVFAESEWHKKQFIKYGKLKGFNVVTSGYPKLDAYNQLNKSSKNIWKIDDISNTKKIVWAPHWSIGNDVSSSTFHYYYKEFQKIAQENQSISWIFKPHQRLRYYLEETGFMTRDEINRYYEFWDNLPNTKFYNECDYIDIFKTSDALITDCGSFLAEYLPTQNPILLLVNKNMIGYNEIGKKLVDSYYKAYNNEDIEKFLQNVVLSGDDVLKGQRLSNLNLVQPNPNGAGMFIANHIKKELGL